MRLRQLPTWTYSALAVGAAAIAYYPILGHYFFADDFYNLYRIRNDPTAEYILKPQGGHLLVTTYVIFYLSDWLFGANPLPYFISVLALHLLNTLLLFAVVRRTTDSDLIACAGALLWGVCPTHIGSLGWYSVFGHVVLGTAVLWLLYDLVGLARSGPPSWPTRLRWVLLLYAAATSFGVGLGVAMVFPVMLWLLLPPTGRRLGIVAPFIAVALSIPVLYVALHRMFQGPQIGLEIPYEIGVHYLIRQHGLRLLDLTWHMAAYGVSTTLVSTLQPNLQFPSPLANATVAVFLVGLAGTCALGSSRTRRIALAALVLLLGGYGMIVAGRVNFYALNPGVADATRYHYVASMAVVLLLGLILQAAGRRLPLPWLGRVGLLAVWAGALVGARLHNGPPFDMTERGRVETGTVIMKIRQAIEAAEPGETVEIPANEFQAMGPYFKAHTLFPGWAGVFVIYFPENVVAERRVHFMEPDFKAVRAAVRGKRSAGLIWLKLPEPKPTAAAAP